MHPLLLTFYGDDFTGSTDVMESLEIGGVPTVLFLEPPTPDQLERFPAVRAVGVAGVSRTMSPAQMDAELRPAFRAIRALNAPIFHYKVCSTFDSSPTIGSIGHALDLGAAVFEPPVIPLVVGAPALNRFVVFGHLFARIKGVSYRLDRHPTMSKHPITPMTESDLRLHLGKQTEKSIGLIDVLQLDAGDVSVDDAFDALMDQHREIILFDTIHREHLLQIGRKVWSLRGDQPIFAVGSSGLEYALTAYWQQAGVIAVPQPLPSPGPVDQLLVVAGSAAPTTAEQIDFATAQGFVGVRLNAPRLIDPETADAERAASVETALRLLAEGRSVLLYSSHGPDDEAISATNQHMARLGFDPKTVGSRLGTQQGMILREVLERTGLKRACVAGGDTCGYAAKQLGIYALQVLTPIAPGAPLCRASSDNPRFDGLEISLKGGQNGVADYFVKILNGGEPVPA
jgi:uncharacterized protein YgbK (DUF1537 family)